MGRRLEEQVNFLELGNLLLTSVCVVPCGSNIRSKESIIQTEKCNQWFLRSRRCIKGGADLRRCIGLSLDVMGYEDEDRYTVLNFENFLHWWTITTTVIGCLVTLQEQMSFFACNALLNVIALLACQFYSEQIEAKNTLSDLLNILHLISDQGGFWQVILTSISL